jgi:signal transduction histidine kinase
LFGCAPATQRSNTALVKTLVELHGGTIALKASELNAGSTFQVRLPVLG